MKSSSKTRILVEGALMIALATILSYIKLFNLPYGGSITFEMIPLILMGLRNGPKWGCFTGLVHSLLQMIIGFENVLYCTTLLSQVGCILLDYLVAFTVLGLALVFAKPLKNQLVGVGVGTVFVGVFRFVCSFLSGVLIWGGYAPDGMGTAVYSFLYNGAYMLPDIIICVVVLVLLKKFAPKLFKVENA
ncbi:MAG: energy-coupled thiamine transporter ThiT [Oscillospiraceae bacterium]|nr:energy-coupled thiamine transporter ThiT [Oscillospiraceae bacterium]